MIITFETNQYFVSALKKSGHAVDRQYESERNKTQVATPVATYEFMRTMANLTLFHSIRPKDSAIDLRDRATLEFRPTVVVSSCEVADAAARIITPPLRLHGGALVSLSNYQGKKVALDDIARLEVAPKALLVCRGTIDDDGEALVAATQQAERLVTNQHNTTMDVIALSLRQTRPGLPLAIENAHIAYVNLSQPLLAESARSPMTVRYAVNPE